MEGFEYTERQRASMARLLVDSARRGAQRGKVEGRMCKGCAFRPGTEANNDKVVFSAAECLIGPGMKFHCHERPDQKCVGYLNALNDEL